MSRRIETAYKARSPGESAPHDKAPDSGDLPASGRSGSRQRRPRMLRLCSESYIFNKQADSSMGLKNFIIIMLHISTNRRRIETQWRSIPWPDKRREAPLIILFTGWCGAQRNTSQVQKIRTQRFA